MTVPEARTQDAVGQAAAEGFVYGYPLVLMDATRPFFAGHDGSRVNRLSHVRAFPDASFTAVVSPNADTLISLAWLDLAAGPLLLGVPDTWGRYYVLQIMD